MTASHLTCADAEQSLGALVLGALDPQERDHVETHVRSCASCSSVLAELAPLPGLLHRVELTADELGPPPPELLERALASLRAGDPADRDAPAAPVVPTASVVPLTAVRRRRRATVGLGLGMAAAAVALVAVGFGVHARLAPPEGAGATVVAAGTSSTTHVTASIAMTPHETGTVLDLTLSGVTPGEHCQLVAVAADGTREVASSWVASYDGEASVTGSTWLTLADISRLDITTVEGRTLLQVPVPA